MNPSDREGEVVVAPAAEAQLDAARKRAAVETYARNEAALRRTARRYSICEDDAEDALQRALEILLRKAPTEDPRELVKWTQTVVKHEALAVRRERERLLSGPAGSQRGGDAEDWVSLIPSPGDGPQERTERREAIARSREALQSLKPQELRALTLLAEGYSYREIGEMTGYSATKINRCLAEGRERFRSFLARSASGGRCEELGPLISAFCDGEAGEEEARTVREHLRACANCRATLRAYRAAPRAAAALAPALPGGRPLLERAQDAIAGLTARFGGGSGAASDSALTQIAAAGGTRGAGMAALAKVLALCVGTVGGAAACVATGVVPDPIAVDKEPAIERTAEQAQQQPVVEPLPEEAEATEEDTSTTPATEAGDSSRGDAEREAESQTEPQESESGAIEYVPPPPSPAASASSSASAPAASAAGEFGP